MGPLWESLQHSPDHLGKEPGKGMLEGGNGKRGIGKDREGERKRGKKREGSGVWLAFKPSKRLKFYLYFPLYLRPCVIQWSKYRSHSAFSLISWLISLGCLLSVDPNNTALLHAKKNFAGIGVWYGKIGSSEHKSCNISKMEQDKTKGTTDCLHNVI